MGKRAKYGGFGSSADLRHSSVRSFCGLSSISRPRVCVAGAAGDREHLNGVRGMLCEVGLKPVFGGVSVGYRAGIKKQTIDAIRSASASVLLLTPQSVRSPNMLATAGAAMISGKPVISVLAGGLQANQIPRPLQGLNSVRIGKFRAAARKLGRDLSRGTSPVMYVDE